MSGSELQVPDEALRNYRFWIGRRETPEREVAHIALPVVVADRRRLAADIRRLRIATTDPGARAAFEQVSLLLDGLADQLEAGR